MLLPPSLLLLYGIWCPLRIMSEKERLRGTVVNSVWPEELKLAELLMSEIVRSLHATMDHEWDPLQLSACQISEGRVLWNDMIHDPVTKILAGERFLRRPYEKMRKYQLSNAREVSGMVLAAWTLWFDSRIEAVINSFEDWRAEVVLLSAGQCLLCKLICFHYFQFKEGRLPYRNGFKNLPPKLSERIQCLWSALPQPLANESCSYTSN